MNCVFGGEILGYQIFELFLFPLNLSSLQLDLYLHVVDCDKNNRWPLVNK